MDPEIANELAARSDGPFNLRLLLQPTISCLFALRDGRRDAASGEAPYLQRLTQGKFERREALTSAWASLAKVMTMALVLDSAFQFATTGSVSILEAVLIAFILCAIPYSFLRGPTARFFAR